MKFIFFVILLFPFLINCQNLVINPGFEEIEECPNSINEYRDIVKFWKVPRLFHTCSSNPTSVIPENPNFYKRPKNGDGFASIYTYHNFKKNYRGHCLTKLKKELKPKFKYYVKYYISSLHNDEKITGDEIGNIMTNKIGVLFFCNKNPLGPNWRNNPPITNYAQIYEEEITPLLDGWEKNSGTFIADSSYKYLGIGNFFSDENIIILQEDGEKSWEVDAKYGIDDV